MPRLRPLREGVLKAPERAADALIASRHVIIHSPRGLRVYLQSAHDCSGRRTPDHGAERFAEDARTRPDHNAEPRPARQRKASVGRSALQSALRKARELGLTTVQNRGRLTNVVRIIAPEWLAWLQLGDGGGAARRPLQGAFVNDE
jgi:hypothetical protein